MSATIHVCDTCNYKQNEKYIGARTGGEVFYDCVKAAAQDTPNITVQRFSCLMNCHRHCSVALTAPQKIGYVLGGFSPTQDHAKAVVEYAKHYANSETGEVSYSNWPKEIMGKFASRIPPSSE
jgi:predicted metal-binding protein